MGMDRDLYGILGVARVSGPAEIKAAYRKLARECHPDAAGEAAGNAERFKEITKAYEVLSDPTSRGRYDRRFMRRTPGRMAGGFNFWGQVQDPKVDPTADGLDLEDIFGHHGGRAAPGAGTQSTTVGIHRPDAAQTHEHRARTRASGRMDFGSDPGEPSAGRDIALTVEVPSDVAEHGGTVTVEYERLRTTEDRLGSAPYPEICDVRVFPGTRHGDTIRVPKYGHAGDYGGPYGDLVCDVVLRASSGTRREPRASPPSAKSTPPRSKVQSSAPLLISWCKPASSCRK